ncbi:MAG: lipopolysaccharide biosynthesis protein [Candidatus Woesearchaeota archaeon]
MIKRARAKLDGLLTEYSPRFGLDLNYFVKGGFWLGLDQGFNLFKYFILSILFANFLTKEVYGQYSFVMGIVAIASIFTLPNLIPAVVQSISKGKDGIYLKAVHKSMLFSLLGSLFMLGASIFCQFTGREYGSLIFLFLVFLFPFYYSSSYFTSVLIGKEKFKKMAVLNVIFSVVSLVLIGLVVYVKQELFWIILATVVVKILVHGYYSFVFVRDELRNDKFDEKSLEFGMKTNLSQVLLTFSGYLETLLIPFFLGFESLAIYAIITLIPNQVKISFNSLSPLFLPKLSKKESSRKELMGHTLKIILIAVVCIIGYVLVSPFVFKWFYFPYYNYVWLSMLFSLSLIILPYNFLVANIQAKLDVKKINRLNFFNAVFLSVCVLIGLQFGLFGLVISRIVYRSLILISTIKFNYSIN